MENLRTLVDNELPIDKLTNILKEIKSKDLEAYIFIFAYIKKTLDRINK